MPTPPTGDPTAAPSTAPSNGGRPTARSYLPRALVMLLGAASAVIVLAGVRETAWLVGPAFLALVIVIALSPVQGWLRRRGWPSWLSTLVLVVLVTGLLLVLGLVFVVSIARLAALLPQYAAQAEALLQGLAGSLQSFGVSPAQLQAAAGTLDPSTLVGAIGSVLDGLTGIASSLVFLLTLLLFLSVEAAGTDRRLAAVAADRPDLTRALRSFAGGTRSYLVVTTVFGLIVAVLDTIALAIIGIPLAALWGLLSFITNYIPNVGFVIGVIPPAILALLTGGWELMLLVIGVYMVLNFIIQSLIQPRFVGDSVGLSMTVTFLALIFWAWLLGPLGALLAIPLTLLVKSLLVDVDPRAAWASALGGSLAAEPRAPRPSRTPTPEPAMPEPLTPGG